VSVEWETPDDLFARLDAIHGFEVDLCATQVNAKCEKFYSKEDDSFSKDWVGICWMNPPYGRELKDWIEKAYFESIKHNSKIVALVPAYTYTDWFHKYVNGKAKIDFIRGRPRFKGAPYHFRTGLMVVTWDKRR